ETALRSQILAIRNCAFENVSITRPLKNFENLPDYRFSYQLHPDWIDKLNRKRNRVHDNFLCKKGLSSGDDTRNLRLFWEPCPERIEERWKWLAKGGEFSRYRSD